MSLTMNPHNGPSYFPGFAVPPAPKPAPAPVTDAPTFTKPLHPAVRHLLTTVEVKTLKAMSATSAQELSSFAGSLDELEAAKKRELAAKLGEEAYRLVNVKTRPGMFGRVHEGVIHHLVNPNQVEDAIEAAFAAGVKHAARQLIDEGEFLLDKY